MLTPRGLFELTTYGDAAFAIAGWNHVNLRQVDRWTEKEGWVKMSDYPIATHRHCAVPDPGYDKIYSFGGSGRDNRSYVYIVSADTWTAMPSLYWGANNIACGIIRRRSTGNKIIVLVGDGYSRTQYFDLTVYEANGSGEWNSFATPQYYSYYSTIVTLTPYESFEVKVIYLCEDLINLKQYVYL